MVMFLVFLIYDFDDVDTFMPSPPLYTKILDFFVSKKSSN